MKGVRAYVQACTCKCEWVGKAVDGGGNEGGQSLLLSVCAFTRTHTHTHTLTRKRTHTHIRCNASVPERMCPHAFIVVRVIN